MVDAHVHASHGVNQDAVPYVNATAGNPYPDTYTVKYAHCDAHANPDWTGTTGTRRNAVTSTRCRNESTGRPQDRYRLLAAGQ